MSEKTEIQKKIIAYLGGRCDPSPFTLWCFVGMIETGEATLQDFIAAVDGVWLAKRVQEFMILTQEQMR